jgi:hypothetical protein
MNAPFPGEKRFLNIIERRNWSANKLNWTARVVCEPCNVGWMSKVEEHHPEPAMSDLIAGKVDIPIPQSRANSIALFALKLLLFLSI